MIENAETRLDGTALVVRIPMRFQRRGGRKRIVAPDGSDIAPTKPQPDGTLVKALARAWRWKRLLDEGRLATVAEIADAERINPSYVSRVLRLTLLAPDLVEAVLQGRWDVGTIQLTEPWPLDWEVQREDIRRARTSKRRIERSAGEGRRLHPGSLQTATRRFAGMPL